MVAVGFNANAQDGGFNVGANLGLPTGLGSDVSSFTIGAEANYLFDVSEVFKLGPSVGFLHYFGKDNFNDVSFSPLAGALRFNVSEKIALGGDIGYGVGINDGNEGGFYYRSMFGYNVSDKMML